MTDRGAAERLQPSLLDRLTDDEPGSAVEPRDARVIDIRRLREIVRRDLAWLFNTTAYESLESLERFPNARVSALNFGVPDLAGITVTRNRAAEIRSRLTERVKMFEPRILPDTLTIDFSDQDKMTETVIGFDIRGELWAEPLPIELYMRTELDVTNGVLTVRSQI
ncbi:MAG: type VI secretion system baseplate subunit TssE [Pikeienuella sp.]